MVGVNDKAAGPEAFVGSYLDLGWLRRRVYALTQPNFSIDIPDGWAAAAHAEMIARGRVRAGY